MHLNIGRISTETQNPEVMIPACLAALKTVNPDLADKVGRGDYKSSMEKLSNLINCLNDYVPAYCYVGVTGQGLGVWPDRKAVYYDSLGDRADILCLERGTPWPDDMSRYLYAAEVEGEHMAFFDGKTGAEWWRV
jgi:hypothetical protein